MINVNDYHEVNGTHYHNDTPDELIVVLERARENRQRVAIVYQAESIPVFGRIGRSCGPQLKVPLVIHNTRAHGGDPICTGIVLEIRSSDGKQLLYQAAS